MPRSKIFLPDVNVWLALASRRHVHHRTTAAWLDTVGEGQAAFCRVTQMGLLRLLTNRHAMGDDLVNQSEAWRVYRRMAADPRIPFLAEPAGIEPAWQRLTQLHAAAARLWTDAYLQAFAELKDLQVVSFDRDFLRFPAPPALILK